MKRDKILSLTSQSFAIFCTTSVVVGFYHEINIVILLSIPLFLLAVGIHLYGHFTYVRPELKKLKEKQKDVPDT